MNRTQYRKAVKDLGLSMRGAGPVLGVTTRQGMRYSAGSTVPETIVRLLTMFKRHGIPEEWQPKRKTPKKNPGSFLVAVGK